MRKVMWTVAGLAGMSLLLCGQGELLAQSDTATDTPGTADRDASDTRLQGSPTGDARVGTPGSAGFSTTGTQATGTGTGGAGTDTDGTDTGGAGTGTAAAGTGGAGTGGAGTGTAAAGAGQATGGAGAGTADQQAYVQQLESEVAQLRQEVAQLRAALADPNASAGMGGAGQAGTNADTATGGSGQAGVTPPVTTPRSTPLRAGSAQETNPRGAMNQDTSNAGEAVVNAIYTGTVRSVSGGRLELLDEDGQPFSMELGNKTRVLRDGKTISTQQLKQGTRVRVTVDLVSPRNQVMEIVTLPAK